MSKKLLVASLLPVAAIAAPQTDKPSTEQAMVVTATRFAEPQASILAPVNIITREEINRLAAHTVTEVVRTLPGVEIGMNGGRGQSSALYVRGGSSGQTLVLIDGVRASSVLSGSTDLNQLPLTQVERIEYIRGARASIYGSDAITGVINIITRSQRGDNKHGFNAGAGSLDHQALDWSSSADVGAQGHVKAAAAYETEDGYNVHPQPGINDGDKHGFLGRNAMLDYQHQLTAQVGLFGTSRWVRNSSEYDASYGTHNRKENWNQNLFYQLGGRYDDERYRSELQANYATQEAFDYDDTSDRQQASYATYTDVYNSSWLNSLKLNDNWDLGAGIDWRREVLLGKSLAGEDWMTGQPISYAKGDDISRNNTGLYALSQYQWQAWSAELSARSDDNQQYGRHNTWQAGAGWAFVENHRLSASYGTAFRAPTFTDLYYPGAGNPDLKPEESKNLELSLEGMAFEALWRVTAYRNQIDQMLQWDSTARQMSNIGEARLQGIELEGELATGVIEHRLSADFKDPEDSTTGEQLIRRSKRGYKWVAQTQWQKLDGAVTWLYQGERPDTNFSTYPSTQQTLGGYSLWDLAAGYQLTTALKLQGRISNLFDKQYETAIGYPAADREYFVNFNYQL